MMMLFRALHVHAAERGDGLLPQFLAPETRNQEMPKPANENMPLDTADKEHAPRSRSR